MKNAPDLLRLRRLVRLCLLLAALLGGVPMACAGLTIDIHLYFNQAYFAYGWLHTNGDSAAFPTGTYSVSAPQYPTGGTQLQYQSDGVNLTYLNGGGYGASDFPSLMQSITNGSWTIRVTNATSTNTYSFTVSAPVLPADLLSFLAITFPMQGTSNVVNQPDFAWQGPTGWEGTLQVTDSTNDASGNGYYVTGAALTGTQTSWASPMTLPNGSNTFNVTYLSNVTALIVASTPLNSSSVAISTWASTATLEEDANSVFSVGGGSPGAGTMSHGHTLVAHYTFDDPDAKATDSSGNGNSFSRLPSYWGSSIQQYSTDAAAGAGAIQFFGDSGFWTFSTDPGNLFSNLVSTLAGSFSVSLWLNTANIVGSDTDDARNGAVVMDAFNYDTPGADGVIPVAITGSKLAFYTGDGAGQGGTLHSVSTVVNNNDTYVHVVVTRDQTSGQKLIYINGALDASGTGSLDSLNGDTNYFALGGVSGQGYTGLLDDVQIYAGVLGGDEVAYLFQNPGATMGNASASGLVASYDFDEGNPVAADVSGHGNNLVLGGFFGSGKGPAISLDSVSGSGSVSFDGGSFLSAPPTLLPVVAGTFSISLWVKTGQNMGQPNNGFFLGGGAGIIAADVPGLAEDLVPVCLTGGVIGFNTGGSEDDTLYSATSVNDNSWHHVVVTRDQSTGMKQIFIDGAPDAAAAATT
ncbi:MAG TPA: LamG domain-containing protein, partial [Candidatus Acidoferrum sp.]|nr:LamG domain-containing protein [Candidatus Acidoferrum sp.]